MVSHLEFGSDPLIRSGREPGRDNSGYFHIEIAAEGQEKTTFTCPIGTYAYRRMPFGLCNAPATY